MGSPWEAETSHWSCDKNVPSGTISIHTWLRRTHQRENSSKGSTWTRYLTDARDTRQWYHQSPYTTKHTRPLRESTQLRDMNAISHNWTQRHYGNIIRLRKRLSMQCQRESRPERGAWIGRTSRKSRNSSIVMPSASIHIWGCITTERADRSDCKDAISHGWTRSQ